MHGVCDVRHRPQQFDYRTRVTNSHHDTTAPSAHTRAPNAGSFSTGRCGSGRYSRLTWIRECRRSLNPKIVTNPPLKLKFVILPSLTTEEYAAVTRTGM